MGIWFCAIRLLSNILEFCLSCRPPCCNNYYFFFYYFYSYCLDNKATLIGTYANVFTGTQIFTELLFIVLLISSLSSSSSLLIFSLLQSSSLSLWSISATVLHALRFRLYGAFADYRSRSLYNILRPATNSFAIAPFIQPIKKVGVQPLGFMHEMYVAIVVLPTGVSYQPHIAIARTVDELLLSFFARNGR